MYLSAPAQRRALRALRVSARNEDAACYARCYHAKKICAGPCWQVAATSHNTPSRLANAVWCTEDGDDKHGLVRQGGSIARTIESSSVESGSVQSSTVESNYQPHAARSSVFRKSVAGRRQAAERFSRVTVLILACLRRRGARD